MAFVSLLGNEAVGFYVCSADFFFSSDLKEDGCELDDEDTSRGVNRCMANLMTNNEKLKLNCNTLSITKECSQIPGEGLSKFL